MEGRRDRQLDLIRAAAVVCVIAVHFFINCGFYEIPSGGETMTCGILLRTQLMVCVPLFLLITGYLQGEKVWDRSYGKKFASFLLTYVLASLCCALYRGAFLQGPWSPKEWLRGLLSYRLAPYAWYIELYIGLFLLIPFLNLIWRGSKTRRGRGLLVGILVFLAVAPSLNPIAVAFGWKVFPGRWEGLYPVAYYFTGRYLRDYPPRWGWPWLVLVDLLAVVQGGLLHAYQARGECFGFFAPTYWNGAYTYLASVCVFLLLKKVPLARVPQGVQRGISRVAVLSLPIFLVSWVPEQVLYPLLNGRVPLVGYRLPWLPVMVAAVLAGSVVLALLVDWVQRGLEALARKGTAAIVRRGRL